MAQSDISQRLKEVREYLGLSQHDVAEKTGIPRPSVSAIENGKRRVEAIELQKFARLYGYPVTYFLGEEPQEDVRTRPLFRAAKQLSDADLDEVVRFAEYLRFRKPGN